MTPKGEALDKAGKGEPFWISTAGFAERGSTRASLRVSPGTCRCGHITDGIALAHGNDGAWVISFKDLERIYKAAVEFRAALSDAPAPAKQHVCDSACIDWERHGD